MFQSVMQTLYILVSVPVNLCLVDYDSKVWIMSVKVKACLKDSA